MEFAHPWPLMHWFLERLWQESITWWLMQSSGKKASCCCLTLLSIICPEQDRPLFFLWMCHYRHWKMLSQEAVRQFKREKMLQNQRNWTESTSLVRVGRYINITPARQPLKGDYFLSKYLKWIQVLCRGVSCMDAVQEAPGKDLMGRWVWQGSRWTDRSECWASQSQLQANAKPKYVNISKALKWSRWITQAS